MLALAAGAHPARGRAVPGWSAARTAVRPQASDAGPLVLAGSSGAAAALGFAVGDADVPGSAKAQILIGRDGGRFGARHGIAGADSVLAAGYLSNRLVLLLGTAPAGLDCCTAVAALAPGGGSLRAPRPLLPGLTGPAQAALVPDGRRLLAVIATDRGVWSALSSSDGRRFGAARRLSPANESPEALSAVPSADGGATVAWTARSGRLTAAGPTEIVAARASSGHLPGRARLLVRVANDHAVDELSLASAPVPELAWVESDVDASGRFRSVVRAGPLGAGAVRGKLVSRTQDLAGGLSVASRLGGPVLVAWRACSAGGRCSAEAAIGEVRRSRASKGRGRSAKVAALVIAAPRSLGSLDPEQAPVTAVTGLGTPVVAWIGGGAVRAVAASLGRFGRSAVLARTNFASELALAAAGSRGALAAWVEGTARERVVMAARRG